MQEVKPGAIFQKALFTHHQGQGGTQRKPVQIAQFRPLSAASKDQYDL